MTSLLNKLVLINQMEQFYLTVPCSSTLMLMNIEYKNEFEGFDSDPYMIQNGTLTGFGVSDFLRIHEGNMSLTELTSFAKKQWTLCLFEKYEVDDESQPLYKFCKACPLKT